jgi:hypothetical protein
VTHTWFWRCIEKHPEIVDPYLDAITARLGYGDPGDRKWLATRIVLNPSYSGYTSQEGYVLLDRLGIELGNLNDSYSVQIWHDEGRQGIRFTFIEHSARRLKLVGYQKSVDFLRVEHMKVHWKDFERDVYDDTGWKIEELVPGRTITVQNYRGDPIEREVLDDASKGDSPVSKVIFGAMQCR